MTKNNLIVAFCSIRPKNLSKDVCLSRENEYLFCLKQLFRVMPGNFSCLVCDNTGGLSNLENPELKEFLSVKSTLFLNENIGEANKGIGELSMLVAASEYVNFESYDNVCYLTARRIYTCPYVFEKTQNLSKEALISNPDFLYVSGEFVPSHKEKMYNDMFFSMTGKTMKRYADYSNARLTYLMRNGVGSEQNLYAFIDEHKISYEWLEWLGIVRNDWERDRNANNLKNFHIC